MNEIPWTRKLVDEMRRHNALVFPIVGSRMQPPGWPDRIVSHTLWSGLIEFKGRKTKVSKAQKIVLRELRKRNKSFAYVVRQPDRIEDEKGNLIACFDGTGRGLLLELSERVTS